MKEGHTDRCMMCHSQPDTVEHIIPRCQTLAADQDLNRHNQEPAQNIWIYVHTMESRWMQKILV